MGVSSWQPIMTAPRETALLAFFPEAREGSEIMICHFVINLADKTDKGNWYANEGEGYPLDVEPTHWMPLPARPECA